MSTPGPVRGTSLGWTRAASLLVAALAGPLPLGAGRLWAGQTPAPPERREPDVITREPLPADWQMKNWEIEQLATPVMAPPADSAKPGEAAPGKSMPAPQPRARESEPAHPQAESSELPQLGPEASFEQRVRVPQAGDSRTRDLCELVRAERLRPPPGLDCSAAALPPGAAATEEPPAERPAAGRVQSADDAPGVPMPGGERSGVQVLSPQ